jgi:hypothetical protein
LRELSTSRAKSSSGEGIDRISSSQRAAEIRRLEAAGRISTTVAPLRATSISSPALRLSKFDTLKAVAKGLGVPRWYLMATEERIELKRRANYLRGG